MIWFATYIATELADEGLLAPATAIVNESPAKMLTPAATHIPDVSHTHKTSYLMANR